MKKLLLLLSVFLLLSTQLLFAQSWSAVHPAFFPTNNSGQIHGISRISQVKFHATNPAKWYAVSARGGLFLSSDTGRTWAVAPGCDYMAYSRFSAVCVDHTNDNIIYLASGDANYYYTGSGILKSTNGGTTFTTTGGLNGLVILEILMDPLDHNVLIAATSNGIYKTTNAGSTWTINATTSGVAFYDLQRKANSSSRVLYAASSSDFYLSNDFGSTWTKITSGIYIPSGYTAGNGARIAVSPADSNRVYFAFVAKNGTIFKSTDGGLNFTNVKDTIMPNLTSYDNTTTSTSQGNYNFAIGTDPVNPNILYLSAHNQWKSTDGGATWTQLTNWWVKVHTDMHQIIVDPYKNDYLLNMNDGGVWLSADGGNNWTPRSDGLYGYEIYHGSASITRNDLISIGTQDNGELFHNGNTWYCNRGGDWSSKEAFDWIPGGSSVYYFGNAKRRALLGGGEVSLGLPRSSYRDIGFYKNMPELAFVGDSEIYRTTNLSASTPTWTQISALAKPVLAVHICPTDSNILYAICNDQRFYVCNNALSASPTFTSYALPSSVSSTSTIAGLRGNKNVIYIAINNKVYRSSDGGATWVNKTANLPSVNYVQILIDQSYPSNELVFVGGGSGSLYYKKAGDTNWTLFTSLLPSRPTIQDMMLYDDSTSASRLRVTTYGRGVWEASIANIRSLQAIFTMSNRNPCQGSTVTFTDLSNGTPTSWSWSFPGGTPSTSNLQNPSVTYSSSGVYSVTLTVSNAGGNNTYTFPACITTSGLALPVTENFESSTFPSSGWSLTDPNGDQKKWALKTGLGGFGTSSNCMWFDNYSVSSGGAADGLLTPRTNLSGLQSAWLSFDVAYAIYNSTYKDSLRILASQDCGTTWNSVYLKTQSDLATAPSTTSVFVPTAAQWRRDSVNLGTYLGNGGVQFNFQNIGRYGNNLYIDNISITGTLLPTNTALNLKLYLQGLYQSAGTMVSPLYNAGLTSDPTNADSVMIELHSAAAPYGLIASQQIIVKTNGTATASFPTALAGSSYYIVVKHRNSIETWSKNPVLFSSSGSTSVNFTAP